MGCYGCREFSFTSKLLKWNRQQTGRQRGELEQNGEMERMGKYLRQSLFG